MSENTKISIDNMNLHYGSFHALKGINMEIPKRDHSIYRTKRLRQIHTSEILKPYE